MLQPWNGRFTAIVAPLTTSHLLLPIEVGEMFLKGRALNESRSCEFAYRSGGAGFETVSFVKGYRFDFWNQLSRCQCFLMAVGRL